MLLFGATIIISIPAVQTVLINNISDRIFKKIGHDIDIGYINIRWFDTILIRDLLIYDTKNHAMVKADQLILDFKFTDLISDTGINFDNAILQGASVEMFKNAPGGQFNLNFFIDEIKRKLIKKKPGRKPKDFITDKIILTDSRFKMFRDDREIITERFDQYHFTVENIDASITDFSVLPGGIMDFKVNELQCVDSATGMNIRSLKMRFHYTRQSMAFQNMEMKFGISSISQSMVFSYKQPSSLKEFVDSVKITANVKKSIIYTKDLGHFAPGLKKYNDFYRLKGFLEGPVNRFAAKNIILRFGDRSELRGYISMYGLPLFEETFISAKIRQGDLNLRDLTRYISDESYQSIKKFGNVKFSGGFSGFPGDFVSNASFETDIGKLVTDINLKIGDGKTEKTTYSGRLKTENFDLGIFFDDTLHYQLLDMDGSINGSGFKRENAKFNLVSTIRRIGINGYEYQNIKTDATLAEQFFNGNLNIDDPNLQFDGKVGIDLNKEREIIKIEASLGKARLDTMKITDKPAMLSSVLNVDMRGLSLDEALGDIFLTDTYFSYDGQDIYIDSLQLISEKDSLSRSLRVESPVLALDVFGDFDYSTLFSDLLDVYKEYRLIFRNNSNEIAEYYAAKKIDYSDYYYLDYDINLRNINPVIKLFLSEFFISKSTTISGGFTGGPAKLIELKSRFDTLKIDRYTFIDNNINLRTQKSSDTTLVYASWNITSQKQNINEKPKGENLNLEINWDGNLIDFLLNLNQQHSTNYVKAMGQIEFQPDETRIRMKPSELRLIDKTWRFSEDNLVTLRNKEYSFHNLSFYYSDQKINLNGKLSDDPEDNLYISIINFDVKNLNPLITKRLDGVFDGLIDIQNFFTSKEINSRIKISDFTFNDFLVGDVIGFSEFNDEKKNFDVNMKVNRKGLQTMNIEGTVSPAKEDQLDLTAVFSKTNINLIQPFFESTISEVTGFLDGEMKITGPINSPLVRGVGHTDGGGLTLNYLKTHFRLDGEIVFDNNYIDFKNFTVMDIYDHKGTISGRISHNGFKELKYDFKGKMNHMMVLNTTAKDNDLYYGTAFATGDLHIYGQEKVLNISASAVSDKGTRFYIPLEGGSEAVKEEFIHFISIRDSVNVGEHKESGKVSLSGINLNLDLEITPDAYCEIIFDLTAGDIIRGRGNGKLNLQINTQGDFTMFGDYEIIEGGYNFTLYNIINKEFKIEPGSKISWTGDPYQAILDIQASYEQLASLTPILRVTEEDIQQNPELNRKYPAKVLLFIKGNLMYPEINFDIEVEGYPKNATYNGVSIETQMTAFKNKIATDEQELKRQVFSLLILKNFSRENAFNVSGSIEKSVSEFISNQVSYWISQFDENLVIDIDLASLDREAFNTFQLRMSYSFLNGRLRVTRDGRFTDQATGTTAASILGDWTVEYLLTPDGKLRTKIYNRTNYNTLNPNIKSTTTTAGFSLMHTTSFDEIKLLFKKSRDNGLKRKKKREQQSDAPEEGISQRQDTISAN